MTETVDNTQILKLTGKQASVFANVSYARFNQLLHEDDPPPREPDKTFHSDKLGAWLLRRGASGRARGVTVVHDPDEEVGGGQLNPVQERARKDKEMADKTALENRVRRGELVEASTVRDKLKPVIMLIRSRLLRIPFSSAPLVVNNDDQFRIQSILDEQIRDALAELSALE